MANKKGRLRWDYFFGVFFYALMYFLGGMALAIPALYLGTVYDQQWLIWVYRIVATLSSALFVLLIIAAFQWLYADR